MIRDFNSSLKKKQDFSTSISETSENVENVCFFISFLLFRDWFALEFCIYIQDFFDVVRNKLPDLIKRRSKVQEKNMSCERALDFDQ